MVAGCNEYMEVAYGMNYNEECEQEEVAKVTDLTKDLGWDEDRKALENTLAYDLLEAFESITPAELVKHWRITSNLTDENVKQEIRELYDTLPRVKLKAWARVNLPTKNAKKAVVQLRFAECFAKMFAVEDIYVVGKHLAQGYVLPVYRISTQKVEITFSGDFSGWETVVCTDKSLEDFKKTGKFNKTEMLLEGFPEDVKTVDTIWENSHKFSVKLTSDHELYTFMYNLEDYLSR